MLAFLNNNFLSGHVVNGGGGGTDARMMLHAFVAAVLTGRGEGGSHVWVWSACGLGLASEDGMFAR